MSLELITPILDYKFVPYYLKHFSKLLLNYKAKTDKNIGLHIHISTKIKKKLSPIALLYFLDKKGVFKWKYRKYVKDTIKEVFSYKIEYWKYIYENVLKKCYTINFCSFGKNNHIEYRSPGGKGYINKYNKIIKNFISILESFELSYIAKDKEVIENLKNEYKSKKKVIKTTNLTYDELIKINVKDLWIS